MDSTKEDLILTLKNKIKTIIDLYENQKNISKELENNNRELKEKLILLENKVGDVEEKYENLKLARALITPDDKCIALLNR